MISHFRRPRWAVGLLLAAMILLAAPRLGQSLWIDEASSLWFARVPFATLLLHLCDPHPPLFYALLKLWLAVADGEIWLRLLPLLGAALAVMLVYPLGRELCDRRCAWLATGLVALHPLQVWYAGELRMYTWAQALGMLAFLLGVRWLRRLATGSEVGWLPWLYALAAILALFTDYSAFLALGVLQLAALVRGRLFTRQWLALHLAILMPLALWWLLSPQRIVLARSYQPVFVAVQAARFGLTLSPEQAATFMQIATLLLAAAGILAAQMWARQKRDLTAAPAWTPLLALIWLGLLLFMALPRMYSLKRLLVVGLPYLALWLAATLTRRPAPRLAPALTALTLIVTLWMVAAHARDPWRQTLSALRPAEVVWVDDLATPVWVYYSARAEHTWTWQPLYGAELPKLPSLQPDPGGDLLLVTAESPYRTLALLLPAHFSAAYALTEAQHTRGIGVYRYQRRLAPLPLAAQEPPPPLAPLGLRLPSPLDTCGPGQ
ncbi:MAG: glycosyltransferase family 39 protein [Caldilineales bacterium]|nr:glycosyltransferase family 39 protein [Caldilineales bacterium]